MLGEHAVGQSSLESDTCVESLHRKEESLVEMADKQIDEEAVNVSPIGRFDPQTPPVSVHSSSSERSTRCTHDSTRTERSSTSKSPLTCSMSGNTTTTTSSSDESECSRDTTSSSSQHTRSASPSYNTLAYSSLHPRHLPPVPLGAGYPMSASFLELTTDIFEHTKAREHEFRALPNYLTEVQGCAISESMRSILVDWLSEVCQEFKFSSHSLHLAINYLDRFLSKTRISKETLQLCGAVALMIAAKFNEKIPPCVDDYVYVTDFAFTKRDFLKTETLMLNKLEFRLCATTQLDFIHHYLGKFFPVREEEPVVQSPMSCIMVNSPTVSSPLSALPPSMHGSITTPSQQHYSVMHPTTQSVPFTNSVCNCDMSTPPSQHQQHFPNPFQYQQPPPPQQQHYPPQNPPPDHTWITYTPPPMFREMHVAALSVYLSEIVLLYSESLHYPVSMLSASCVLIALLTFNFDFDLSLVAQNTTYSLEDLAQSIRFVYNLYVKFQHENRSNSATKAKFLKPNYHHIASIMPYYSTFENLFDSSAVGSRKQQSALSVSTTKTGGNIASPMPQTPNKSHSFRGEHVVVQRFTPLKSGRVAMADGGTE